MVGQNGEIKGSALPPVEVIFGDVDVAEEFRTKGATMSKAKKEGVSHLYFNACLTLSTRLVVIRLHQIISADYYDFNCL